MAWGRRFYADEERQRSRRRRHDLDPEAVEAAAQTLLEVWPWLSEQYREHHVEELPTEMVAAAIRRYMEHVGQ